MVSDAGKRANGKYRKENVKSFNVKFFPADADIWEYFKGKDNRNRYIKDLIRKDMERISYMLDSRVFKTANKGDVAISVVNRYYDGAVDIKAEFSKTGVWREWVRVDGGATEEIFEWLFDKGAAFENDRSLWFEFHYVEQVMIEGSRTEDQVLDALRSICSADIYNWYDFYFGDYPEFERRATLQ